MTTLPIAQTVLASTTWSGKAARCELDYTGRFLRRKRLTTSEGKPFLLDLEQTTSLNHGDALQLDNGDLVEVIAAREDLLRITGDDLVRFAWHVGNRHTPCQINKEYLLIQADPVIGHMLEHLGATITAVFEVFMPEGGAYGHGRTHSHEHGATAHDH
jgi:urease accessory protein